MADPIVRTAAGRIRGTTARHGLVFRGVPFAAPPVGARRFRPPVPPERWDGVRDCVTFGSVCPQFRGGSTGLFEHDSIEEPQDEDCLFLNVFTPAVDDGQRPVMVWIHGGSFATGSGSSPEFDGDSFARDDAVLVSVNYRLHALGFLYLDELFEGVEGTGNLGILDQVAALEWVGQNIAAFGGDPTNVTIFGQSAGGMSVGTLLGTPRATGLFHRAIAQSGAGAHNLKAPSALAVAKRLLDLIGVRAGDWDALQDVPTDRLVDMSVRLSYAEVQARQLLADEPEGIMLPFSPTIDGVTRSGRPDRMVGEGKAAGVDLLVGTTAEEYRLFLFAVPQFCPPEEVLESALSGYFAPTGRSLDEVLKVYSANRPEADPIDVLSAVHTDAAFTIPAVRLAEAQLAHNERVWMYRFDWRTPVREGALGACHFLEVPFVFERLGRQQLLGDRPPTELASAIHGAWVRFAATGSPEGGTLPAWPAYSIERREVMGFDTTNSLLANPSADERELWDGLW